MSGFNDVTLNIPELGAPVPRRFHKAVLCVGRFVDPVTGEVTNFDRASLAALAKATNRWIGSGNVMAVGANGSVDTPIAVATPALLSRPWLRG